MRRSQHFTHCHPSLGWPLTPDWRINIGIQCWWTNGGKAALHVPLACGAPGKHIYHIIHRQVLVTHKELNGQDFGNIQYTPRQYPIWCVLVCVGLPQGKHTLYWNYLESYVVLIKWSENWGGGVPCPRTHHYYRWLLMDRRAVSENNPLTSPLLDVSNLVYTSLATFNTWRLFMVSTTLSALCAPDTMLN